MKNPVEIDILTDGRFCDTDCPMIYSDPEEGEVCVRHCSVLKHGHYSPGHIVPLRDPECIEEFPNG